MGNPMLQFLMSRRSVRRYRDEEVDERLLYEVLEVARWAPSSKNRQPWEFILIRNPKILKELSKHSSNAKPLEKAKAAVAVIVDVKTSPKTYLLDAANVTLYILLAAHALDLGSVWINALDNEGMREVLKIPEGKTLVSIIALGWPEEQPEHRPRKRLREILHIDYYGNMPGQQLEEVEGIR